MKLFAAIAATSMLSQAMLEKIKFDNEDKILKKRSVSPNHDYRPTDSRGDENRTSSNFVLAVEINKNEPHVCFTEEETQKVGLLKVFLEQHPSDISSKECDAPLIPWEKLEGGENENKKLTKETAVKTFHFLKKVMIPAGTRIPKPMPKPFNETKLSEGYYKTDDEGKPTDKWVETDKVDLPKNMKKYFAYKVEPVDNCKEEIRNGPASNHVAGKYGSIHFKNCGQNDPFLNQADHMNHETSKKEVNNPQELISVLEAANYLEYQDLLDYAAAKLASGIRINDLHRLRALFGFSPTGEYFDETYVVVKNEEDEEGKPKTEEVKGYKALEIENSWYKPRNDAHAEHKSSDNAPDNVDEDYKFDNVHYPKLEEWTEEDCKAAMEGGEFKKTWIKVTSKDGSRIFCKKDENKMV